MIRLVRGLVTARGNDHVVIDLSGNAGGLGVSVAVPAPTLMQLTEGSSATLHTHLQVREDILALYGFETQEELTMFELLLGVNGVGPKVALAALSTLGVDTLQLALANEEPAVVSQIPGVGKRTAQKIILELKDKVTPPDEVVMGMVSVNESDVEVIEALISLGCSVVESQRVVQQLPSDVVNVEDRLRLAISML